MLCRIPLNDDRQEKAARLQSRQALHDLQLNTLRAAASPVRKLAHHNNAAGDSPKTPRGNFSKGKENLEDGGVSILAAPSVTPLKRVPLLANFEEWMKMATDNKINATNSWNFALIDYFHDMSLLKEGDGVNFQKASCTLDGCVKIYTSRVDSVATETGKLLSGLADSGNKTSRREAGEGVDGEENDEEGDDTEKRRLRKKHQRSSEQTLAPSFATLQLKKMELEFSVDPLFKKASADFDEGGAKGLLLNHLVIDSNGRIVFDSSDDIEDRSAGEDPQSGLLDSAQELTKGVEPQADDVDIASLGSRFFPDVSRLDTQDICPSLKNFNLGDPEGSLSVPSLKAPDGWREKENNQSTGLMDQTGVFLDGDNVAGFEDDEELLAGFEAGTDAAFGDGGEAWAKQTALDPQIRMGNVNFGGQGDNEQVEGVGVGAYDPDIGEFAPKLHRNKLSDHNDDLLNYFDRALQKTWAGPEHWRIRKIKESNKAQQPPTTTRKKEKEPLIIDFQAPLEPHLEDMLYTPAASNAAITLPKAQWRSKTRNLLPDDKHFNSKQLLRLFLKPKTKMGSRRRGFGSLQRLGHEEVAPAEMDEAFWAKRQTLGNVNTSTDNVMKGDYDANFFQDDAVGYPQDPLDDDGGFVDAKESLPLQDTEGAGTGPQGAGDGGGGAFGTQLVTQTRRLRPDYVQYARVAKKVDVRRLKEEMWKGIEFKKVRLLESFSQRVSGG